LLSIVPRSAPMLTVTFEYRQHEMDGPPFSVSEPEVRARLGGARHIELLESREILEQAPGLRERGLSELHEHAFLSASRER
jgi:thiopurine S-methyltransferase